MLEEVGFEVRYYELSDNVRHLSPNLRAATKNYRSALPEMSIPFRWAFHRRGQDAFAGETHGDKLYGRGTSDMKSGVAAKDCHGASAGEDFASKSRDDAHLHGGRRDHLRGRLCRDCKSLVWSLGNKEPKYDDD